MPNKKSYRFETYATEYATAYLVMVVYRGAFINWRASMDYRWNVTDEVDSNGRRKMRPGSRASFTRVEDAYQAYEEYVVKVQEEVYRCEWQGPMVERPT